MSSNATAGKTDNATVTTTNKLRSKTKGHEQSGESNPAARLTEDVVRLARKLYKPYNREYGVRALARRFGVSFTAMQVAISGKGWAHVQS